MLPTESDSDGISTLSTDPESSDSGREDSPAPDSDPEDASLPLEGARPDSPMGGQPHVADAPWWTYRAAQRSAPTPLQGDLLHILLSAVLQAVVGIAKSVRNLENRVTMDCAARFRERTRSRSLHQIAENFFGGDNIGNLAGQLIVAQIVRPWEAPLLTEMLAHRLLQPHFLYPEGVPAQPEETPADYPATIPTFADAFMRSFDRT